MALYLMALRDSKGHMPSVEGALFEAHEIGTELELYICSATARDVLVQYYNYNYNHKYTKELTSNTNA